MARAAINIELKQVSAGPPATYTSYTVPANKTLIFKAFAYFSDYNLSINNINMARVRYDLPLGPFTANAGDVVAMNGTGAGGISGFIYDA